MASKKGTGAFWPLAVAAVGALLLIVACSSSKPGVQQTTFAPPEAASTPVTGWSALLLKTPYPYLLALPEPTPTLLDGTYSKLEQKDAPPVHCLRCPAYAAEGGTWKLQLDRGVFRIFHEATGWQDAGSFVLSEDRETKGAPNLLVLFNDPVCPKAVGLYTWNLEGGKLNLKAVEDSCSFFLRAVNLGSLPWDSCQPPSTEAGITDHWPKPLGCD
jgi:hypothetical protein